MATPSEGAPDNPPVHVLIVGGGPSGLATAIAVSLAGHRATVFEVTPPRYSLQGSGVITCPNATRLLSRWGLEEGPEQWHRHVPIEHWQLCNRLGTPLGPDLVTGGTGGGGDDEQGEEGGNNNISSSDSDHGTSIPTHKTKAPPPWAWKRGDLVAKLRQRAIKLGATVHLGARVTDVRHEDGNGDGAGGVRIRLHGGEEHRGDLVVVAQGTHSRLRNTLLDQPLEPVATGYTAFRMDVSQSGIVNPSPKLVAFMDGPPSVRTWVGQGSYVTVHPMDKAGLLSLLVLFPGALQQHNEDTIPQGKLIRYLKGWDDMIYSMLDAADAQKEWTATHLPALPEPRHSPQGTSVLVGDAANTMSHFLSQGLSLDLEDAAALGCLLGHVRNPSQIPAATALYSRIRNERAQRLRDMTAVFESQLRATASDGFVNGEEGLGPEGELRSSFGWSYDAYAEAEKAFNSDPF
ncbi:monooxygenase [Apiospora saccharicola]